MFSVVCLKALCLAPCCLIFMLMTCLSKSVVLSYNFADDLKMFCVIQDAQDFQRLQDDINKFLAWDNKWQLRFNISKCFLLHFGKDLGVLIDDNFKFHSHATSVISKANWVLFGRPFISQITTCLLLFTSP